MIALSARLVCWLLDKMDSWNEATLLCGNEATGEKETAAKECQWEAKSNEPCDHVRDTSKAQQFIVFAGAI